MGKLLAEEFHARYYDRELLNLAAKESGFSEEFFHQSDERKGFFRSFFHLPYFNNLVGGSGFYQNNFSQESLFKFQSDAIIKAAQEEGSCVFVGRCADYVLRDFPDVVNVFITASIEARAQLFMKEKNVSHEEAVVRIQQAESRRASYYNYYTGKHWGRADSYDLCVDSSALGPVDTANLIAEFVRKKLNIRQ